MSIAASARARVRVELTREILDAARRQLVESGAQNLSLRAVSRSLGMAPSGMYRYFAGRDELLTALIIDSYAAVGGAAQEANGAVPADDHLARWEAVTDAIWGWGHTHPQEWALVYGSPVPGYRAPEETVPAALIVLGVIAGIIVDAAAAGRLAPAAGAPSPDPDMGHNLEGMRVLLGDLDEDHLVATVVGWSQIFGLISLHLFGHLEGAVLDPARLWRQVMALQADQIGLRPRVGPTA